MTPRTDFCFAQAKSAMKKSRKKRKKAKSRKGTEGIGSRSQPTANDEESEPPASQESHLVDEEPIDGLRRLFRVGGWLLRIFGLGQCI